MSTVGNSWKPHATREEIARRTYEIYLQREGTGGTDLDNWLIAERESLGDQDRSDTPDRPSVPLHGARTASEPPSSAEAEDRGLKPRGRGAAASS